MKLDYSQSGGGFGGGDGGDGSGGLMQMECISGCRQPGGCLHKKPETRQEIRMKVADEEEEGGRREEKKSLGKGGAGVDESVNWDCSEEGGVNTITLHVTEHTVTVRLEARYRPSSP